MSKILVVEDNPDIGELLRDALVKEGFETIVCKDAYQGIEFARTQKPDLILLDLMLPAGGGFSVLKFVKISVFTQHIPVIVLTASKDPEDKKKALQMGVTAYVEKPYDSKELVTMIRGFLKK